MKKMNFDKTLLEAVDNALLCFGDSPRKAIYFHLTKGFKLQKENIVEDADEFSQALNNLFGPGAQVIEKLIVKNLFSSLNLNFEEKTRFEFGDYISMAKQVAQREQERTRAANRKKRT